jgi:hypothetical protein
MRLTATFASVGQQQPLPQSQQQDAEEAPTVGTGPVAGEPPVAVFAATTGTFSTTRTITDFDGMLRQSRSDNMYIPGGRIPLFASILRVFWFQLAVAVTGTSTERWFGSDEWVTDVSRCSMAPVTEAVPLKVTG